MPIFIKLIPVIGAVLGAIVGLLIDGNAWRGGSIGVVIGAVGLPAGLWLLWAGIVKLLGLKM